MAKEKEPLNVCSFEDNYECTKVRLKKILKNKRNTSLFFSVNSRKEDSKPSQLWARERTVFSEILQASIIFRLHIFCVPGPRSPGAPREVLQAP
jgi:hypothetical protein